MIAPRIFRAGDSAMVVRFENRIDPAVNGQVESLARTVARERIPGVRDIVPTFRSLAVYFDPLQTDTDALSDFLEKRAAASAPADSSSSRSDPVRIPVSYGGADGPDLDAVAAFAGLTPEAVIAAHTARTYRVFMQGFVPGFAYLASVDERIAMPRLDSPRASVPAGSVGIAGLQTGIYPAATPGGWRLIGRTSIKPFDLTRRNPFLFKTGDLVQFYADAGDDGVRRVSDPDDGVRHPSDPTQPRSSDDMPAIAVAKPGLHTTVQDLGRWGHQASGVSVSGAMDLPAHRTANAMVGNPPSAATLEVTLVGPELVFDDERTIAVSGAIFVLQRYGGRSGEAADHKTGEVVRVPAGATLRFGARTRGARAYLAVSGGFDVPEVLGSRSTHVPSALGGFDGRALKAGDRIALGALSGAANQRREHIVAGTRHWPESPVRLRVLPAPDLEMFDEDALGALASAPYVVRSESNRMGFRLRGPLLQHRAAGVGISDAAPLGLIQVPPSGEPVLLMADRPTTGGYPGIANVITADIGIAAQLAPGDAVRFAACSVEEALESLFELEGQLESLARQR